jgi:hypothetical protein
LTEAWALSSPVASATHKTREDVLDKICNIAILLAFLISIVAAFAAIPYVTAVLIVLGAIGGLNTADKPEYRVRIYTATAVLILGSNVLTEIPAIGGYLESIFTGIAAAFVGMSLVALTLAISFQAKANLLK